ncbi:hypothetical protein GCM10008019_02230 [Deinococcus soli (ex Cha et al. 2016)]|nr:hypothetical protein GCM10008019_02230 [Deinococcus soli (ex Cha et al. 2016)]
MIVQHPRDGADPDPGVPGYILNGGFAHDLALRIRLFWNGFHARRERRRARSGAVGTMPPRARAYTAP